MNDQDRGVGQLGEGDDAIRSFILGDLGTGDGVEVGGGVAGCFETRGDEGDDVAVFGVDHGCETELPG